MINTKLILLATLQLMFSFPLIATQSPSSPDAEKEIIEQLDLLEKMDEVSTSPEMENFEEMPGPIIRDDKKLDEPIAPTPRRKRGRLPYGDFPGT